MNQTRTETRARFQQKIGVLREVMYGSKQRAEMTNVIIFMTGMLVLGLCAVYFLMWKFPVPITPVH